MLEKNAKKPTTGATAKRASDAKTKTIAAVDNNAPSKKTGTKTGPATTEKTSTVKKVAVAGGREAVPRKLVATKSASTKSDKTTTEAKQQEGFTKAVAAALLGAKSTKIRIIKDTRGTAVRKIITTVKFRRPRSARLPRNLKIPWKLMPTRTHMDSEQRNATTTEADMKNIENNNKLVFLILLRPNKNHIKACEEAVRHQALQDQHPGGIGWQNDLRADSPRL